MGHLTDSVRRLLRRQKTRKITSDISLRHERHHTETIALIFHETFVPEGARGEGGEFSPATEMREQDRLPKRKRGTHRYAVATLSRCAKRRDVALRLHLVSIMEEAVQAKRGQGEREVLVPFGRSSQPCSLKTHRLVCAMAIRFAASFTLMVAVYGVVAITLLVSSAICRDLSISICVYLSRCLDLNCWKK